jgi:hypothetical protein
VQFTRFSIEIITGKGLDSQGEAVPHPRIKECLVSHDYQPKSSDKSKTDAIITRYV